MATMNPITPLLTPPDQVFNKGRDYASQLGVLIKQLEVWADTYEKRIGKDYFDEFKWIAGEGEELTASELEHNTRIDYMAEWTLQIVQLYNSLRDDFLTDHIEQVIGRTRTDM